MSLCRAAGAATYLSGPSARDYIEEHLSTRRDRTRVHRLLRLSGIPPAAPSIRARGDDPRPALQHGRRGAAIHEELRDEGSSCLIRSSTQSSATTAAASPSMEPTARGVDWNSEESQELRFEQLLRVADRETRAFCAQRLRLRIRRARAVPEAAAASTSTTEASTSPSRCSSMPAASTRIRRG